LILGIGFAIGGYCPGTACVAVSTGKIDAVVYVAGVIFGIFVFGEAFPVLKGLYNATPMGQITLPQLLKIPYGLIVFFVSLMAVGGFAGATWVEKTMAAKKGGPQS
jgi:uncharacterized protein